MNNRANSKCLQCGLVNFVTAEACKRCGTLLMASETVETSVSRATHPAPRQSKSGSSFRDVAITLGLIVVGFAVRMIGGALFLLRSEPQKPRKFSSKAEQLQAYMNSYSEADCDRNDRATSSSYHTMTPEERATRYMCGLKAMKAQNPAMFEEAMKPLRSQPPDSGR